ncbi:MAG: DUF1015 family protein [Candidatus Wallbacteria bacterium]|nr:DUF1015 family protein [Candidatus Wallbacteria bacterium]
MSVLKSFRGLRPKPELIQKVASLPYDVLNSEEARKLAAGNPCSLLHVSKPEIDLDPSINLYDDRVYQKARENFRRFISEGILVQDPEAYLYIYQQQMGEHVQTGILGCASVDDYLNNVIKKHELTRKDKEDDRTRHTRELNANSGPVFLTYRAHDKIDRLIDDFIKQNKPENNFTAGDGIRHTLWVIRDQKLIKKISSIFENEIPRLYVADGHHRSASAARVGAEQRKEHSGYSGKEEFNFFLAVYFPHNQLRILDYNRVVKDLNGVTEEQFFKSVADKFKLDLVNDYSRGGTRKPFKPGKSHEFGMYLKDRWFKLTAKEGTYQKDDPVLALDVSILQLNLLEPVLGIQDPRVDKRIDFVGGIRGLQELEKLVDSGKFMIAFAMHPTTLDELMRIADNGKLMPPKSTWFEPKLRSGVVIHLLD